MAKINYELLPERVCLFCGNTYKPTGPAQQACLVCKEHLKSLDRQVSLDIERYRKFFTYHTIGKGNSQGRGELHHSYKNGISLYQKIGRDMLKSIRYCELCGKDLLNASRYKWCTHHKDFDRTNNKKENLQLMCKSCHQILHECIKNIPQNKRESAATILREYLQVQGSGECLETDNDIG